MGAHKTESLVRRIGEEHLSRRLAIESSYYDTPITLGYWKVPFRTAHKIMKGIERILAVTGLLGLGRRNLLHFRVIENRPALARLPAAFRGFRILHLSDLHIEAFPDGAAGLREFLRPLEADMLVITGDFRYENAGECGDAMRLLGELIERKSFQAGLFAVLGNHDAIEMVPFLERMGIRVLLNEAAAVRRGAETLWVCGVDDPHFFELHDVDKALKPVPADGFKIFLAHSPDIVPLAVGRVDLYLCGHAHGGQICLPGEVPILANLKVPRRLFRGAWNWQGLEGYTSRGTGASGVPVRFFSRPEVTLHLLGG